MPYHNETTPQGTTTAVTTPFPWESTTPFPWDKPRDFGADWPCDCIPGTLYLPDRGRYSSDGTMEGISEENMARFPRLLRAPQGPGWDSQIDVPEGWAISIDDPREWEGYRAECWVVYRKSWRTHAPAGALATDGTPIGTPGVALTPEEVEELKLPLPGEPGGPPKNYIRTETRIFCKGKDPRKGESGGHDVPPGVPEDPQGHWPCLPVAEDLDVFPEEVAESMRMALDKEQADGFRDRLKNFGLYPLEEMSDEELDAIGGLKRGEVSPGGVRRPESVDPSGLNPSIPTWSDMNDQVKEDRKLWDEMSESQKEGWRDWLKREWDRERELKEIWGDFPLAPPTPEMEKDLERHENKWGNSEGFVPSENAWSPPGWGWDPEKGWIQGNPEHEGQHGRNPARSHVEPFIDGYSGPLGGPKRAAFEGLINRIYFKIADPTWVANNPTVPPMTDVPGLNIGDRGQGWEVAEAAPPGSPPLFDPQTEPISPWQLPQNIPEDTNLWGLTELINSPGLINSFTRSRLTIQRNMLFTWQDIEQVWENAFAPVIFGEPSRGKLLLGGNVSPPMRTPGFGPNRFRLQGRQYLDSLKYPKPPKFEPPTGAQLRDPDYFKDIVPHCTGTSVWPWVWTGWGWREALPGAIPEQPWFPVKPPEKGKPQPTLNDMINRWNQMMLPPPIGPSGASAIFLPGAGEGKIRIGGKPNIAIPEPTEDWEWRGEGDPFEGAPPWYKWDGLFFKQWIPIGWECPTRPSTPADLAPGGLLGPPKDPVPDSWKKRWRVPPGFEGVDPGQRVAQVDPGFRGTGVEADLYLGQLSMNVDDPYGYMNVATAPGPGAPGPETPGLDAPPGWEWDAPSIAEPWPHAVDDWGRPAEPTQGGWKMPFPGDKSGLLPKIPVPHPGPRWKWIPAKQVSPPNKKGESYWRPGYWEDRGQGKWGPARRPWKRGEAPGSIPDPELHVNPGSRFRVNPDRIPGLAPDIAFPRRWPNPLIDKWKGHRGPRLPDVGAADPMGLVPGGHGPRIPPLIKLGPGDKIDLSLGTPLTKEQRAELAAELFNRNIPLPPDLEEFREALENARAGGRENIGEG